MFELLATELLQHLGYHCDAHDILSLARACRLFHHIFDEAFWR